MGTPMHIKEMAYGMRNAPEKEMTVMSMSEGVKIKIALYPFMHGGSLVQ